MNPTRWVVMHVQVLFPLATIALAIVILGLVQLTELQRERARGRIREALRLSDISMTKAAEWMLLHSSSELDKMLKGEVKLDYWRLEMLPKEFHQHLHFIALRDLGLPELFKAAIKMAPAFAETNKETA